jgi:predicted RNase H-like HicB family nuclease
MNVNKLHYSLNIQWSDEDQVYLVTVPELPGCITHGKTYRKALKNAQQVIELWVDSTRSLGRPIPAPRVATSDSV